MIFYFSGTGNSLYAAKKIAEMTGDTLTNIASAVNNQEKTFNYTIKDNETIGFVFPVHAWGPPKIVLEFVEQLHLSNYRGNYTFAVLTYGGMTGNSIKVLEKRLQKNQLRLTGGFSVRMPRNCIILSDVDSKEREKEKLSQAEDKLQEIGQCIKRRATGNFVKCGILPRLLTALMNPLFLKRAADTTKFHVKDGCIGCGTCARVCNLSNIRLDEKPVWGKSCALCLACLNYCPAQAIQYDKSTEKRGRYTNPNIAPDEMV